MMVYSWAQATIDALQKIWAISLNFIPQLIGAIVVFLVGWIFAIGVGRLVAEVLSRLSLDKLFKQTGWTEALAKADLKVDVSAFIGGIVKWILVVVFLSVSVEILGLVQFAIFIKSVLAYLPNVIVAALIFAVTVIMVDIVEKIVRTTIEGIKIGYGQVVSIIVKWSIWIFSSMAILYQLGIARPFMETLFQGLVYTLVIAFGLSFGLGGKDVAAEILRDLKNKLK